GRSRAAARGPSFLRVRGEQVDQAGTDIAAVEAERPGQFACPLGCHAMEQGAEAFGERLGQQNVPYQQSDVLPAPPRPRLVLRELAVEQRLDRVEDVPHATVATAPG